MCPSYQPIRDDDWEGGIRCGSFPNGLLPPLDTQVRARPAREAHGQDQQWLEFACCCKIFPNGLLPPLDTQIPAFLRS